MNYFVWDAVVLFIKNALIKSANVYSLNLTTRALAGNPNKSFAELMLPHLSWCQSRVMSGVD